MFYALRLLFASALVSLTFARAAEEPIRIGEYASITGKEASLGQSSHNGTMMAIDDLNAAGGVLGRPLLLITEDTQSKPGESATAAKKLISRDKVVALLGEVASSRSLEAAPVAQLAKVPMISPASTNPKVTETGNYIFRTCFIDPFQGPVMAKFAQEKLRAQRVALMVSNSSAYSIGLAKFFREAFTANGGTIVLEQKYAEGDKDFKAQLTAIKAAGVDAVFNPGYYNEGALIVLQARDLGLTLPIFGADSWEAEALIELGGKAIEGAYLCSHYSPLIPRRASRISSKPTKNASAPRPIPTLPSATIPSLCSSTPSSAPAPPTAPKSATPSPPPKISPPSPATSPSTPSATPRKTPSSFRSATANSSSSKA